MAKYRHRVFEMYEFRDEASCALTPKSARPAAESSAPESWKFKCLTLSRSESVTHVQFKPAQRSDEVTINDREFSDDLVHLADVLARDSKVLFDFAGVTSFSSAAIDELALFKRKLLIKGSRIALCSLGPAVRQSFFPGDNGHE